MYNYCFEPMFFFKLKNYLLLDANPIELLWLELTVLLHADKGY